jgi:hypothetical protein
MSPFHDRLSASNLIHIYYSQRQFVFKFFSSLTFSMQCTFKNQIEDKTVKYGCALLSTLILETSGQRRLLDEPYSISTPQLTHNYYVFPFIYSSHAWLAHFDEQSLYVSFAFL